MKKLIALLLISSLVLTVAACKSASAGQVTVTPSATTTPTELAEGVIFIKLGDKITVNGSGAVVSGQKVTITSAGTYSLSGAIKDGQVLVDTQDQETVKLLLNGADISCSTSAPIYVINAEKTVITLADGTTNSVTDGKSYVLENQVLGEPSAAIFSSDDLTINGNGALTVNASYNNGIQSKDDLNINGGNITINAVNDGLKGRDSVEVKGGTITIKAGGDGLQSNNDEDPAQGFIAIEGGTLNIFAGTDGIQAETSLTISSGSITISSGGGSDNSSRKIGQSGNTWGNWGNPSTATNAIAGDTSASAKGLKAGVDVTITGGTIKIDSSDDSIHAGDNLTVSGGKIDIASGDDGMHTDTSIGISAGDISITKSYEGIESGNITIDGGTIRLVSSDDGINVVGGNDGSAINGRPGQNTFATMGNNRLYINNGNILINAEGDGIDVNGPIDMTGGIVIVNGPTRNDNGALDYTGAFKITGGYLLAVGSSGMAQAPSTSSTQCSLMINLSSALSAGTLIHIETESGENILTFKPARAYQSVVFCSADLKNGSSYVVYSGGNSTGTVTDGLYSGGQYTAGTKITSLKISGMVTTSGSTGGIPGGIRR